MSEDKVYKVMYKEDLEKLSRDELEYYANTLQIKLNIYITYTKDLEHEIDSLKKTNTKLMYRSNFATYRKRAHTYKVELGRCRRKLTRIYRLFEMTYHEAAIAYYKGEIPFEMVKAVREVSKELRNV